MRPVRRFAILLLSTFGIATATFAVDPDRCNALLEGRTLTFVNGPVKIPTKYRVERGPRTSFDRIDTYDLQKMLGEHGNKIDAALYEDANTILFLSDGADVIDRLGPAIAQEFPKKTVVSAELDIVEDGFLNNWGLIRIDNTRPFPAKDDSFDRVILRRGMCVCHHGRCCAGFKPASPDARNFLRQVVRILNKKDPHALAVLHGMYDVGMGEIWAWSTFLDEIAKTEPIRYRMMMDRQGMFHSILIQPAPPRQ